MSVADESISYEMLQDMLRSERRSNKLTPVNARFWHDVRAFLDEVMAMFREEQQKDPFSRRVMMVTDEVKHARNAAESIWALRERKMSLYALAQVRETAPARPEGLTAEEQRIYDHILASLQAGRRSIMEGVKLPDPGQAPVPTIAPTKGPSLPPTPTIEAPAPPVAQAPTEQVEPEAASVAEAPAPVPTPEPTIVPADTPDVELITIKALSDIPAFVGPDMQTYLLKQGDVATVPEPIAKLLERRKKAAVLQV